MNLFISFQDHRDELIEKVARVREREDHDSPAHEDDDLLSLASELDDNASETTTRSTTKITRADLSRKEEALEEALDFHRQQCEELSMECERLQNELQQAAQEKSEAMADWQRAQQILEEELAQIRKDRDTLHLRVQVNEKRTGRGVLGANMKFTIR